MKFRQTGPIEYGRRPPYIELIIKGGTEKRNAEYITGSGTTSLEFGYTVQDDDRSPDGIVSGLKQNYQEEL